MSKLLLTLMFSAVAPTQASPSLVLEDQKGHCFPQTHVMSGVELELKCLSGRVLKGVVENISVDNNETVVFVLLKDGYRAFTVKREQ